MNNRSRLLSWGLFLAAPVLLSVSGYGFFAHPTEYGLVLGDTDIDVAGCVAGQETIIHNHLQNTSGHSIRLVGSEEC